MKTDAHLQREVQEELDWEPSLDAAHIGVTARDGVVTLTGFVAVFVERQTAEEVTKQVHGVKAVANEIDVRPGATLLRADEEIAAAAVAALEWNAKVPSERLQLTVRDGWITLEGAVNRQYEKVAAQRTLRHLVGTRGVTNRIHVEPRYKAARPEQEECNKQEESNEDVKSLIQRAFRRNAIVDSKAVEVEIHDHTVVLNGHVHSCAERDESERIAWAAPGVTKVENRITIT